MNVNLRFIACERFDGNLIKFFKMEEPFSGTGSWPLQTLKDVIQQAAEGLTFVHHRSCTHKDIKPSSFVVRKGLETVEPKWVCKLTDFGLSKSTISEELYYCGTNQLFETTEWVAPELLSYALASNAGFNNYKVKLPFTQKSDVWSFGCVIHFAFSKGSHPFGSDERERLENISKDKPLKSGQEELGKISQPTFKVDILVGEMIQRDVEKRPNMNNVLITIRNWQPSEDRQVHRIETAPKKPKTNQDISE